MFYAILENGGKQYKAVEGESLEVDLLPLEIGKKKTFDKVMLLVNEKDTQVGSPYLDGISVDCTVVEHFKGEKVTIFKYRAKQRFRVKTGHRQPYTRLMVESIAFPGKSKTVKAEPAVEEKASVEKKVESKPATSKAPAKKTAGKTETKTDKSASPNLSIEKLDLGSRANSALADAGITKVGQLLKKLESGEDALMDVQGIGSKTVDDIKKKLKKLGYKLP
jgi:large subunit ribosomal protein L21